MKERGREGKQLVPSESYGLRTSRPTDIVLAVAELSTILLPFCDVKLLAARRAGPAKSRGKAKTVITVLRSSPF